MAKVNPNISVIARSTNRLKSPIKKKSDWVKNKTLTTPWIQDSMKESFSTVVEPSCLDLNLCTLGQLTSFLGASIFSLIKWGY